MLDTPAIRNTYGACVTVDQNMQVYMSANLTGTYQAVYGLYKHCFYSSVPMPSYLTAMVIGELAIQVDPNFEKNTMIIAQPNMLAPAAAEFIYLQTYLDAAANYVMQPYIWGDYRVVVMPPSYPMSGVEYPMLNMVSPTIITGVYSQEYVVIHDIAHSWVGNQVSVNNWEDLWLAEGFATFIQRHVVDTAFDLNFAMDDAFMGNYSLWEANNGYGQGHTYNSLHPVLQGDDPDNSFSIVPFEKGFQLLYYIENIIGYTYMEDFIEYYIFNNNLMSIDQYTMRNSFETFVATIYPGNGEMVNSILA